MHASSRTRGVLVEATKVLVIFVVFYLLQTQIFEVQSEVYGRTSGLAEAQAQTSTELGDTREFLRLALEDSAIEITRAKEALERSLRSLEEERARFVGVINERARRIEEDLRRRLAQEQRKVSSLAEVAFANSRRIEKLRGVFLKDSERMKELMLFPTVQLRGRGTVGSGVLIYSEPHEDASGRDVYTTFVLTACHVVQEVLGDVLEEGKEVGDLQVMSQNNDEGTENFSARLTLFDIERDVALLRLNSGVRFRHLAQMTSLTALERLDVFSPAYAVGCPLGNRPMPTLGEISSKTKTVGQQNFWMLNAPTFFGNSGGGVYGLPELELIGVSSMIYTYGKRNPTVVPHMGLFVPLSTVYEWLEQEGFRFVIDRDPVPEGLRKALVYRGRDDASAPAPATAEIDVSTDPEG